MHPPLQVLSVLLSFSTSKVVQKSFWDDPAKVSALQDPPSSKFLKQIQEEPWRGGLEPIPTEGIPLHKARIMKGKIPKDLKGVLCRNGPGRTRIGDTMYGHWFDSDGLVSKLTLDGSQQKATFQAKFVQTERFQAQQKIDQTTGDVPMATAGAWTRRGKGKWWQNIFAIPTNPSNTNVLFVKDPKDSSKPILYALAEGGNPVQMDTSNLDTIGGVPLKSDSGEASKSFFSAHFKKDPQTGDIFNHGAVLGATPAINVMKLTADGVLQGQNTVKLPVLTFVHDNLLSENYFMFVVQPYAAPESAMTTSIFGGRPLGKQFEWSPESMPDSLLFVFSKDTLECVAQIPLPPISTYHLLDAFEHEIEDRQSVLSFRALIHQPPSSRTRLEEGFQDMYHHANLPLCDIQEYTIDVSSAILLNTREVAPEANICELPDVHAEWGYKKRYAWTNARTDNAGFLNSLQKVDMETGKCSDVITFGETTFAGSPIFCPRENPKSEDDGYIISILYRSEEHRSDVVILDAATMKQVTLLSLESHVPYAFHGGWYPGLF